MLKSKSKQAKSAERSANGRYLETHGGKVFVTNRATDDAGNANPPATAANFRKLAPSAAAILQNQGADRARNRQAAEAVAAERARIGAILNSPLARGRASLARSLALTTRMPIEQAEAAMRAAPVEPISAADAAPDPDDNAPDAIAETAADLVQVGRDGGCLH